MLYEMIAIVSPIKVSSPQSNLTTPPRSAWAKDIPPTKSKSTIHPPSPVPLSTQLTIKPPRRIARTAGALVLANGGVVRGITNWGPFLLTKPIKKNQTRHDSGHHFIMRFDVSPAVQRLVHKTVAIDPRMVRCGIVKMGERLKDIADVKGMVQWQRKRDDSQLAGMMEWGGWKDEEGKGRGGW